MSYVYRVTVGVIKYEQVEVVSESKMSDEDAVEKASNIAKSEFEYDEIDIIGDVEFSLLNFLCGETAQQPMKPTDEAGGLS